MKLTASIDDVRPQTGKVKTRNKSTYTPGGRRPATCHVIHWGCDTKYTVVTTTAQRPGALGRGCDNVHRDLIVDCLFSSVLDRIARRFRERITCGCNSRVLSRIGLYIYVRLAMMIGIRVRHTSSCHLNVYF